MVIFSKIFPYNGTGKLTKFAFLPSRIYNLEMWHTREDSIIGSHINARKGLNTQFVSTFGKVNASNADNVGVKMQKLIRLEHINNINHNNVFIYSPLNFKID